MEDLLLDEDEKRDLRRKRNLGAIIACILVLLFFAAGIFIDYVKPLPHHDYCMQEGYEAGVEKLGTIMCYKNCDTNKIESCKQMMAVRK